jgi:hypothetical protein
MIRGGTPLAREEPPDGGPRPAGVAIPVRCSSVITGAERSARAQLVGFAAPIGRVSAIVRITDAMGKTATSVVPVELPALIRGAGSAAEMVIPPSDLLAHDLRLQTDGVRLTVRPPAGSLLSELLRADFRGTSTHRQALILTTALHRGALANA